MTGLKTFWITISTLFLLAACVPQKKQTECSSNEAFNASLRTCVPVIGGPSSFILIDTYSPVSSITKYKNDSTTMSFQITISNPYSQTYSIAWERTFNASTTSMCSNSLTCSFTASFLGTTLGEVGTHVLMAKVKDANGATVDTHNFEIRIVDLPKPVINTASITPAAYSFDLYPTDPRVEFSFNIKNNGATMTASDNWRTTWTVLKDSSSIYTESDSFTDFSQTGTNTAYLGTTPTPWFNPATLGVGSYIIRARVQNDNPGEVVAEQQWSVIIKQPDLANVTNITLPAPGITITAHNDVDYNDYPTLSWISGSPATQPNFCVTVDDRDGTYASDGDTIQVRWYLDSLGGEICTKETVDTPGTQTICLIDANTCAGTGLPFDTSLLKFTNTSSSVQQNHKVTARLFDEATSLEFTRDDVVPSNGSYPIEWLVLVKPVNTAPSLGFGSTQPTGCTSSGAFSRTNCQVDQGTNFTVSFTVTDDFYDPIADADEFQWNVNLKHNGADLITTGPENTSCSKAFNAAPTPVANTNTPYVTNWTCVLAVPHYISTGPLDPSSGSFQVVLTAQDSGSPVGGAGLASQSLTWNLVVTETNAVALTLGPQTTLAADSNISQGATVYDNTNVASFATERETVTFKLNVTDPQIDDLQYRISLCTDNTSACTTSIILSSPTYMSYLRSIQVDPDANPVLISALSYTLPEDLLIGVHSPSIDVDTATSRLVYFKIDVIDSPSVLTTTTTTDSEVFSLYVRNYNPAPVINTATASPALGSTTQVYSGYPFTIDPGTVTDASVPASERNISYQWYSKIGAGAWTTITGATSRILRYTPGDTASTIDLKLCVGDGTAANPVSSTGTCSGNWSVTPVTYLHNLTATGSANLQNEVAVWYDDTNAVANTQVIYSAYVDENEDIFVEKTVKDTSGNIILSTRTIQFEALAAGVSTTVSNLSIAGSGDSVYIAYLASSSSAPATMIPRIRRIDKNFTSGTNDKTGMSHPAPFGFNYAHYSMSCTTAVEGICVPADGDGVGGAATVTFSARLTTGDTVEINGYTFTAATAPTAANQICDSNACADINSTAQSLASKINTSTDPLLQGMTASAAAGVVSIFSQYEFDYLDFDGSIASIPGLVAGGLGRIVVSGGRWHLPMINASLGGTEANNITVLSGTADVHMRSVLPNTGDNLTDMGKIALFDNKLNAAGEMVFATISGALSDAGALKIYRYTLTGSDWDLFDAAGSASATDQNQQAIMGTYSFEYVKLATDQTTNPYYYVITKEKTANGGEWHIGRYNNELDSTAAVLEYFLSTQVLTTDSTDDVISDVLIQQPDIISVPGFSEARIFFHSVGTGATAFPRLARWKSDDTVTCGTCFSLTGSLEYQPTARMGISQIANDITLGTAGATAGENTTDLVFAVFSTDLTATDLFKPQLAIINVEPEAIQSTAVDATGMFQPPFVLD
ncbi:MAG: hypothetical protein ACLGHN_01490 [Bacteriovoracia bacterium]